MPLGATAVYTPSGDGGAATIRQVAAAVLEAADIAGHTVLAEAQQNAPFRTGELMESGQCTTEDNGSEVVSTVAFTSGHAAFVEFGTGRRGAEAGGGGPPAEGSWFDPDWPGMHPQPYLRPALDSSRGEVLSAFRDLFTGISGAVPGEAGYVSLGTE